MPSAALRTLGELRAIEIKGRVDAPTIIFFHGYGADAQDLAPLARALGVSADVNWLFPNGPVAVPIGPHHEGRAWFPISISQLEKADQAAGGALDFSREAPPGLRRAREAALKAIDAAGLSLSRCILGGFSQGAMLATDIALRGPEAPLGLAILSGTLVDESNWRTRAVARAGSTFFQCHGTDDSVLSVVGAERLEKLLVECGWSGKILKFDGQHDIPLEAQSGLSVYLRSRAAAAPRPSPR